MEQTPQTLVRMGKSTLLGLGIALICALITAFLFSALLALGFSDKLLPLLTHLSTLLSAVAGGMISGLKGKENGLLLGLCTGVAFGLVHCLLTVFFGDWTLSFLPYLALELPGGVLGGILGVNLRKT